MKTENQIKNEVREQYASIVTKERKSADSGCCSPGCCGGDEKDLSFAETYENLEGYVAEADYNLGCGLPTESARIKEGDTVLDLGSGAGNDAFVARRIVGDAGYVIGVDMTPEMVFKARENKAKMRYENVDFRLGEIENLPVESNSVDVVVSNCVLNLVPDKDKAFAETFRVLKHGGRFSISDIVIEGGDIPEKLRNDVAAYAACVSGAIDKSEYLDKVKSAGFVNVKIDGERELTVPTEFFDKTYENGTIDVQTLPKLISITVTGEKH